MKKLLSRIAIGAGTVGLIIGGAAAFSAFEAHVINVTARIENALRVDTTPVQFGTVFPEEELDKDIHVALSRSFAEQDRLDDVQYVIKQKPKCADDPDDPTEFSQVHEETDAAGNIIFVCDNSEHKILPVLCPYLSKHKFHDPDEYSPDQELDAFHGSVAWTPADTEDNVVKAKLSKFFQDFEDWWNIDLKVPCFRGNCAQDNRIPERYQADPKDESKVFGCDLWIETTGFSQPPIIE